VPDGLFTQRPSEPPAVDLDALIAEVMTFVHPEEGPNVTVPATWHVEDREAPWPTLVVGGLCLTPEGQPEEWTVRHRLPRLRALPEEVRRSVEMACVAIARVVAVRRAYGYTFEDEAPAPPKRGDRRRRVA